MGTGVVDGELGATRVENGENTTVVVLQVGGAEGKEPNKKVPREFEESCQESSRGGSESGGPKRVLRFKRTTKKGPGHKSPTAKPIK
ncbi:stage II sporulation protein E [Sesbania bispinosa]|nr:stage II sporulation protein E [Sesbania bispinosa]